MSSTAYFVALGCLSAFCTILWRQKHRHPLPLPPGPKAFPLIGNLFNLPWKHEWETLTRWKAAYGDLVYLNVVGNHMVVVNSAEAARDLMDKRSAIYSDRPRLPLIDLIGQEWNLGFMNYGKPWQTRKKMLLNKFSKNAVQSYHSAQRSANCQLLKNILDDPENFTEHLRLHSGRVIIDVAYGIRIGSRDHELIEIAERLMHSITIGLSPIFLIFNPVPLLKFFPSSLGGRKISNYIHEWQKTDKLFHDRPFEIVKASLATGKATPSYTTSLLEELNPEPGSEEENLIRDTSALMYGAGADTMLAPITIFFLAMFQNPEVQKTAQEEIDRVVGSHRLPDHFDQQELPYVTAVMKESLRWHAGAPQGIAHKLIQDDEYRGWHLPAGSMIVPNVWGILRDPSMYENPSKFQPERFFKDGKLDLDGRDPASVVFGFGRRICAGEHFAQDTMFLLIAQFLSVFTISTMDGGPAEHVDMTSGGVSFPEPYKCLIVPRSESAKALIESAVMSADIL